MATFFSDLHAQFVGGESIGPLTIAASSATISGSSIDMLTADGSVYGYLTIGTVSASTANYAVKLQESDSGTGSWTDITSGGFTGGTESTMTQSTWITSQYRTKRYVRAFASITGTSVTSVPIHVSCLSMKKILGGNGAIVS